MKGLYYFLIYLHEIIHNLKKNALFLVDGRKRLAGRQFDMPQPVSKGRENISVVQKKNNNFILKSHTYKAHW